jgi:hypothetical protein
MGAGGALIGERRADTLTIQRTIELPCGHFRGPSFQLTPEERADCKTLLPPRGVLGWYCSKPRGPLELSAADHELFEELFPGGLKVVLVVQPSLVDDLKAAIFVRAADGSIVRAGEKVFEPWNGARQVEVKAEFHAEVSPARVASQIKPRHEAASVPESAPSAEPLPMPKVVVEAVAAAIRPEAIPTAVAPLAASVPVPLIPLPQAPAPPVARAPEAPAVTQAPASAQAPLVAPAAPPVVAPAPEALPKSVAAPAPVILQAPDLQAPDIAPEPVAAIKPSAAAATPPAASVPATPPAPAAAPDSKPEPASSKPEPVKSAPPAPRPIGRVPLDSYGPRPGAGWRSPVRWVALGLMSALVGTAGWVSRDSWLPRPPLVLTSVGNGPAVEIRWNPSSLRGMEQASMFFNDGGTLKQVPLNRSQIESGVIKYQAQTDHFTATLHAGDLRASVLYVVPK